MTSLERLRLGVALAHTAPGAEMKLRCHSGQTVVVSAQPTANLTACIMRQVVIASSCPDQPDYSEHVAEIQLGGTLQDLGGGVYRRTCGTIEQRWIATLLPPDALWGVLDGCAVNDVPAEAMHGCVKPDSEIAVTCAVITVNDISYLHHLDEIAAKAMAACLVEELVRTADQESLAQSQSNRSSTNQTSGGAIAPRKETES